MIAIFVDRSFFARHTHRYRKLCFSLESLESSLNLESVVAGDVQVTAIEMKSPLQESSPFDLERVIYGSVICQEHLCPTVTIDTHR